MLGGLAGGEAKMVVRAEFFDAAGNSLAVINAEGTISGGFLGGDAGSGLRGAAKKLQLTLLRTLLSHVAPEAPIRAAPSRATLDILYQLLNLHRDQGVCPQMRAHLLSDLMVMCAIASARHIFTIRWVLCFKVSSICKIGGARNRKRPWKFLSRCLGQMSLISLLTRLLW